MRTTTLIACVGTWLVSLASTVQCADYRCDNGATIPARYITSALARVREQAQNGEDGFTLQQPGRPYKATPTTRSSIQLYWTHIDVDRNQSYVDGEYYEYEVVYSSNFDLYYVNAFKATDTWKENLISCQ
ncbi:unnamed protein product [Blumeria hordei]|uniref:Uncharacterized protein n=1 Tax=Blumeria hordei TaxID=2867405 RepID=A0A383USI2_BLUHO|nr:unnamed protein product [Blumeria hordei]